MNILYFVGLLGCLAVPAVAADLQGEQLWTGSNGKTFRGTLHKILPDRSKAEFLSQDGKILTVALDKLIQADRDRVLNPSTPSPSQTGDRGDFQPDRAPDRALMPSLDPKSFNSGTNDAMVDALWISLLWWNQAGVLEIPKKGGFERKAEWLHKRLSRLVTSAGRSAASLDDGKRAIEEYFDGELKELAACRVMEEHNDFSAARLSRLAQGANAVILQMTMTYANGRDFSACAALESIEENGKFVMHVFGKRHTGQFKSAPKDKQGEQGRAVWECAMDDSPPLPDQYLRNEPRFFMGNGSWNGVLVLKPYLYRIPGKPSPLPADDDFAPAKEKTVAPAIVPEPVIVAKFPIPFTTRVDVNREWNLVGGRKFQGYPVARKGELTVLKNTNGQQIEVTGADFLDEDRAIFECWNACFGMPQSPPRMDLTYRLKTPRSGNFEVKILTEGLLGSIEFPSDRSRLVFDMKDGAFAVTRHHQNHKGDTINTWTGRFLPEHLLPRKIHPKHTKEELDRFLQASLPGSRKSDLEAVPARYLHYTLPVWHLEFRDPEFSFVLIEQPTVLAALFQFLYWQTAGTSGKQTILFNHEEVPFCRGSKEVFPILAACRMMPLKIQWVHSPDQGFTEEYTRKHRGAFSLELVRASVPDAHPAGTFDIPANARAAPPGTCDSSIPVTPPDFGAPGTR
jgi:hypothetical protein